MAVAGILTAQFSTEDFPAKERMSAWREFFGRGMLKVEIQPQPHEEFRARVKLTALPDLGLVGGRASAARFDRPAHMIDSDDLVLAVALAGEFDFGAGNRTGTVKSGGAVLMSGGDTGYCAWQEGQFLSMRVPMHTL